MVPGTNRSKGIITLFSKSIAPHNVNLLFKSERCLTNSFCFDNHVVAVVNIYGPCVDSEKITFINNLNHNIKHTKLKLRFVAKIILKSYQLFANFF